MELVIKVILGLILGMTSIYDLKTKNVSIPILAVGSGMLLVLFPWNTTVGIWTALGGSFLGMLILVISIVSKGQIGFGDGLVFCMTGFCLGFWDNLNLMSFSFLLAGIFGVVGVCMKKLTKKQKIPFLPFVMISYLGMLCL